MTAPSALTARRSTFFSLVCLLAAVSTRAETFKVGLGTGCTHPTVETAVAAAAANGSALDQIDIAYASQTLGSLVEVDSHSVALVGGFSSCTAASPTGSTTLRRLGATDAFYVHSPVEARTFSIENITVEMGPSAGRALRLEGEIQAILADSGLDEGQAATGGNVFMSGAVTLLLSNSVIRNGDTTSGGGGGIYCENGGTVVVGAGSLVDGNAAWTAGGGIYSSNCTVTINSGGPIGDDGFLVGGVFDNTAAFYDGGGIAATDGSSVFLLGTSPQNRAYVTKNVASRNGGGLWLSGAGTSAIARNAVIHDNSAGSLGGGVFVDNGATFEMDVDPSTCSVGLGCSEISWNTTNVLPGGAIYVGPGSDATVRQTLIHNNMRTQFNSGAASVAVAGDGVGATLLFEGCMIYDNFDSGLTPSDDVRFRVGAGATMTIAFSTVLEDTLPAGIGLFANHAASTFRLLSSIVHAPLTFQGPPYASIIDCVITKETLSFPPGGTFIDVIPDPNVLFVDSAARNLHLRRGTPASDYCDAFNYLPTDTDIDNDLRGWDDPTVADWEGPWDIGADEWQPVIFLDGFEVGSTARWSATAP